MSDEQPLKFRLAHDMARNLACAAVRSAPKNWTVTIRPDKRTLDQNAMMHAIFDAISKSGKAFLANRSFRADQWKAILVSAFYQNLVSERRELGLEDDEDMDCPLIEGIEGEFVQLRMSTAQMPKKVAAKFITYILQFCDERGIPTGEAGWSNAPIAERMPRSRGARSRVSGSSTSTSADPAKRG